MTMIKNFETYINEDYFSKLANRKDIGDSRIEKRLSVEDVLEYERLGYEHLTEIEIRYVDGKPIVDVDGDFYMKEEITEIPFQFGKVTGSFSLGRCQDLVSLEGCPKEVGGSFSCAKCEKITSLEGCPEKIGGNFNAYWCTNIITLEGCPKEIGGTFDCSECKNLISLKGCPEKIGGTFDCSGCGNLKSLKWCPKEVNGRFSCGDCGASIKGIREKDGRKLCKVKGNIHIW